MPAIAKGRLLLRAAVLIALFAPGASAQRSHDIVIRSTDKLELARKEADEWYEEGIWPLVGASLAIILTNAISVAVVFLQAQRSFKAVLRQRGVEALAASLNQFYDPLSALLEMNAEIFDRTGPSSFPADEVRRNTAALVWKETKNRILANNVEIETILRTKSHMIAEADDFAAYKPLLLHVAMYEIFQVLETEVYRSFRFPDDIRAHVSEARLRVLERYYQATGEQI